MQERFIITDIDRVIMVGKNEYTEKKTAFSNKLKYNELIFHFSGHATVYFDDLVLVTKPNTIRFLPCGDVLRYEVDRQERGECIFVAFAADREISPCAFVVDALQNEKIAMLFKKLFACWVGKSEGYYFESLSILYRIFAEMQSNNYVPKQHYMKIKPALDYIHEHFLSEDPSVDELAAMCKLKASYFQRLFKEKCGMPPRKYIIQLKTNHACELLRTERYSITQIAEMCNFSSVHFFCRQFKEYIGITPTEFVRKYRSSK